MFTLFSFLYLLFLFTDIARFQDTALIQFGSVVRSLHLACLRLWWLRTIIPQPAQLPAHSLRFLLRGGAPFAVHSPAATPYSSFVEGFDMFGLRLF